MAENSVMLPNPINIYAFLKTLSNPRWNDISKCSIMFDATFNGIKTSFLASANDVEKHGQIIFVNAVNGFYGKIEEYIEAKNG